MVRVATFVAVVVVLAAVVAGQRLFRETTVRPADSVATRSTTASDIARVQELVDARPNDSALLARLAALHLVRARETADPTHYTSAQAAIDRSLALAPNDVLGLVVSAELALARHDFTGALAIAERARIAGPDAVAPLAVLTDALLELGRYDEAVVAAQQLVDRRPDFASYARTSYVRQLHGDVDGAIEAMTQAADTGTGRSRDEAWARVLLGDFLLFQGDEDAAATAYARAETLKPGDAMVKEGFATLAAAQGRDDEAERLYRAALAERPLPEYAIALGDLLWSQGREDEANEQYDLVRAMRELLAANGVNNDPALALFEADQGTDPERAYAEARAVYEQQPNVYAADAAAWAAFRSGRIDEAAALMDSALRIGTRDPRMAYHASVIFEATGDSARARDYATQAVEMEAAQSRRYVHAARELLLRVEASRR